MNSLINNNENNKDNSHNKDSETYTQRLVQNDKGGKNSKMKKIFTPRPNQHDDDDDDHDCEEDKQNENKPSWTKYFGEDELLGKYEPIRELGKGSYGVVFEGKTLIKTSKLEVGTRVAIKKVRRVFVTETDAKRLLRELRILRILKNHESIVRLLDIIPPKDPKNFLELILVFEFVDADLGKIFRTNQHFSQLHVQYMLYQILLGLYYMHSAGICHRDLKPANILINEDCTIKICDFGLARGYSEDQEYDPEPEEEKTKNTSSNNSNVTNNTNNNVQSNGLNDAQSKKNAKRNFLKKPSKGGALNDINDNNKNSNDQLTNGNNSNNNNNNNNNNTANGNGSKQKFERKITRHVVTRWYRSPEVILLQQQKQQLWAVDMWSVGCIFAELMQMQKENMPNPSKRGPLFPGDTCFPLSIKDENDYQSRVDQMQIILKVIGSPNEEEIEKIQDERAKRYLYNLPICKSVNLKRMFPGSNDEALHLLSSLLQFDVSKRINVEQALAHPYFKPVRDVNHEKAHKPVTFSFEDAQLNAKILRELILEEVLRYNKNAEEFFVNSGAMPNYSKIKYSK